MIVRITRVKVGNRQAPLKKPRSYRSGFFAFNVGIKKVGDGLVKKNYSLLASHPT